MTARSIKDKGPMPPFGFITEDQVKDFGARANSLRQRLVASFKNKIGLGKKDHELAFQKFLDTKLALLAEKQSANEGQAAYR
jgi:hypothetical protein